ncbi:Gag protein [Phytophthora palmivora]|uniref:Gag protein n=1 Tax=Phytophthora palmivora TaxID=4796 RepID=A0A2P4YBA1_9STRA|nr:Gag protein [Phytophthora palmivora]
MDGLKVGPSRTQLFRVQANTMEEAIQIALQEGYSHRQARTPTSVWQGYNASSGAVQGAPAAGASTGPVPMELCTALQNSILATYVGSSGTCNVPALRESKGSSLPNLGARGSRGRSHDPRARGGGGRPTGDGLTPHGRSADGARHGGLAPENLVLETRKSGGSLLVTGARNGDKYTDALRESKGRGQVSVRLADGTVVNVPRVRMDLAVKFEDFDSTESFLVLDMNKYDLILSMPALVSNVPTSVRDWGAREGRQGAFAPEEVLGVADFGKDIAMSLATGHETKDHCQACGIATTASPNADSRRAVWASIGAVPDGTDQAGNIGQQAAEAAEESAEGVSSAGNIDPQASNVVPQTAQAVEKDAESAFGVGKIIPREIEKTEKINKSATCVSSVGNIVPRRVNKISVRAEVSLSVV